MKFFILFITFLITLTVTGRCFAQSVAWKGRWTERQTERGVIEWIFHGKENFAKIYYWAGVELDGSIDKGTYQVDTANKKVVLKFRRVFDMKRDSLLSTGYQEEWKIISMTTNELLLSRQTSSSTDKSSKETDKENVYVRLVRTIKEASDPLTSNQ